MAKTIAYLRVSTDQQDLNNQKHEIECYAKRRNITISNIIVDEEDPSDYQDYHIIKCPKE